MPRGSIFAKKSSTYQKRKLAAAAKAISAARGTTLSSRRGLSAPLRTGGFWGQERRMYSGMGPELKVIDSGPVGPLGFATAGAVALLNGVAQGTDDTQRIGRRATIKSILFRAFINPTTTTDNIGDQCRFLLVWDNQANGTALTVANVLNSATFSEPNNLDNRDRFKIIWDKWITMNPAVYAANVFTGGNPQCKMVHCYKKLNLETTFNGSGATIGSIATGSLYVIAIAQNATNNNYVYNCRVRFTDA
ncbi:putative capsid protein [Lake Sarah-associated circular virus-27]|uniref:putative capsid protein n=1 Tax=Lake Sarah-associated circular virus-27 TaxID=1685754 RepID=UPI00077741CA|nr:putative capsid protein [Lake Sarah-associated circular virus-27]ALE29839.1 putative capsid protein [Lake Sarah-associated circular virus-27]